jgi:H+/Cl- antiporter ClcA
MIALLAAVVGVLAAGAAFGLQNLIGLVTNLCWFGRVNTSLANDWDTTWSSLAIVLLPGVGGVIVGLMARYGSPKIRGHGIPEVMESVLMGESKIAPRVAVLKPLSAAIAIGSGGPFGAEGPIIATGGAMGSIVGQLLPVTEVERKTLLAAGAAAGMSAMFGSPVSAVILAVELLLFEMRARSLVPVSVASIMAFVASRGFTNVPLFHMDAVPQALNAGPLLVCAVLGVIAGIAAIGVSRVVYWVEDAFEKLPIHWMWWPAIGGLVVGATALLEPRVLGVGYSNIGDAIKGELTLKLCLSICVFKLFAWSISLGTGTSGGVLAPVLTVGATLGAAMGAGLDHIAPGISPGVGVCALAVMASVFAGTARAPIATVVFALELTHRVDALPAVLACVAVGQLVTVSLMKHTIMTERIARRGIPIGHEYTHDELALIRVAQVMTREVLTVPAHLGLEDLKQWFAPHGIRTKHQGYPVVDPSGRLVGVITRKDVQTALDGTAPFAFAGDLVGGPPITVYADDPVRTAADRLVGAGVGRLIVVDRQDPTRIMGILSRSDILEASKRARPSRVGSANGSANGSVNPIRAPSAVRAIALPTVERVR